MLFLLPIAMICLFYTCISIVTMIGKYLYSIINNRRVWHSIRDKFVLVTYATSEFGEALCMALAKRDVKLVIVGPDEDRLIELKKRLPNSADVLYHSVDIAHCTDFSFIEKYDVGLVINKIGDIRREPSHFIEQNVDLIIDDELRMPLNFLKAVITAMAEKHKGYVVNIAFGHSGKPSPFYSVMVAIRSALKSWTESMYYEMMAYNVNVEYLEIGRVGDGKGSVGSPGLSTIADSVVRTIGNSYFTVPYWVHFIEFIALRLYPKCVIGRIRYNINQERMKQQ